MKNIIKKQNIFICIILTILIIVLGLCFTNLDYASAGAGFAINFDMNGVEDEQTFSEYEVTTTNPTCLLPTPVVTSDENLIFKGWCENIDGSGTIYTDTYTATDTITLYAIWNYKYNSVVYDKVFTGQTILETGNYFLLTDISIPGGVVIKEDEKVNLLLCGHIISSDGTKNRCFLLEYRAELTIIDNKETEHKYNIINDEINHIFNKYELNEESGSTVVKGGGIVNFNAQDGAAIRVSTGAKLNIDKCNFIGNSVTNVGGAILAFKETTINIKEANFYGNQAIGTNLIALGSAIYTNGNLEIKKGEISKNNTYCPIEDQSDGGGVIKCGGNLLMEKNVSITGNIVKGKVVEGGILFCTSDEKTVQISGKISNNDVNTTLSIIGGVVALRGNITLSDLMVEENTVSVKGQVTGGAIFISSNMFPSGKVVIKNVDIKKTKLTASDVIYGGLLYSLQVIEMSGTNNFSKSSITVNSVIMGLIEVDKEAYLSGLAMDENVISAPKMNQRIYGLVYFTNTQSGQTIYSTITDSQFISNEINGEGLEFYGGIISGGSNKHQLTIDKVQIKGNKINAGESTRNKSIVRGGLIYSYDAVTIKSTIMSENILHNDAVVTGLICVKELNISDSSMTKNEVLLNDAMCLGGMMSVEGKVLIDNCAFSENNIKTNKVLQGGILSYSENSFGTSIVIKNGTKITNNYIEGIFDGAILFFAGSPVVEVSDITIEENEIYAKAKRDSGSTDGGIIYGQNSCKLTLEGSIKDNTVYSINVVNGGLILAPTISLGDCNIKGNDVTGHNINGGLLKFNYCNNFKNVSICENEITSVGQLECGIIHAYAKYDMVGCNISTNTIFVEHDSAYEAHYINGSLFFIKEGMNLIDCSIVDNITSTETRNYISGSIYVEGNSTIKNTKITGNEINGFFIVEGAGLYAIKEADKETIIDLIGNVKINDNTKDGIQSNVCLYYCSNKTIPLLRFDKDFSKNSVVYVSVINNFPDNTSVLLSNGNVKAYDNGLIKPDSNRWFIKKENGKIYYSGRILEEPSSDNKYTYNIYTNNKDGITFTYQWYRVLKSGDEIQVGKTNKKLDTSDLVFGTFYCVATSNKDFVFTSSKCVYVPKIIQQPLRTNSYKVIPDLSNVKETNTKVTYSWCTSSISPYKLDVVTDEIAEGSNYEFSGMQLDATYNKTSKIWKSSNGDAFSVDVTLEEGDILYYYVKNMDSFDDNYEGYIIVTAGIDQKLDEPIAYGYHMGDSGSIKAESDGVYTLSILAENSTDYYPLDVALYVSKINSEFKRENVSDTASVIGLDSVYDEENHVYNAGKDGLGFTLTLKENEFVRFEFPGYEDFLVAYCFDKDENMVMAETMDFSFRAPKAGNYDFAFEFNDEDVPVRIITSGGEAITEVPGKTTDTLSDVPNGTYLAKITFTQGEESAYILSDPVEYDDAPYIPSIYHIYYDLSGASGTKVVDKKEYYDGDSARILSISEDAKKEGYLFAGWKDAFGKVYFVGSTIKIHKNIVLYANWVNGDPNTINTRIIQNDIKDSNEVSSIDVELIEGKVGSNTTIILTNKDNSIINGDTIAKVEEKLDSGLKVINLFGLSIEQNGEEIEDILGNRYGITIDLPKEYINDQNVRLVKIGNDDIEVIKETLSADGQKLSFEADEMCDYALIKLEEKVEPKTHKHIANIILSVVSLIILILAFIKKLDNKTKVIFSVILVAIIIFNLTLLMTKGCVTCISIFIVSTIIALVYGIKFFVDRNKN